jgi:hypothetical protein
MRWRRATEHPFSRPESDSAYLRVSPGAWRRTTSPAAMARGTVVPIVARSSPMQRAMAAVIPQAGV